MNTRRKDDHDRAAPPGKSLALTRPTRQESGAWPGEDAPPMITEPVINTPAVIAK